MRNSGIGSNLRRDDYDDEDEPELQWLEDGIHYLVGLTAALIGITCKLIFSSIKVAFQTFVKTK
jgi:hypothetical protein